MRLSPHMGFSLLEVVVALAILSLSLVALLTVSGNQYTSTARARDVGILSMLLRGKMVDIEQNLFKQGFNVDEETREGDFSNEGFADIRYKARIFPITFDVTALAPMCEMLGSGALGGATASGGAGNGNASDANQGPQSCASMLAMLANIPGGFFSQITNGVRILDLQAIPSKTMQAGPMQVRILITQDSFALEQQGEAAQVLQNANAMQSQPAGNH